MRWNDIEIPNGPAFCDSDVVIYGGDCIELLPRMPKVDFVLTDPPYGVGKADWDMLDTYEINALNMLWLTLTFRLTSRLLTFGTASSNVKELCELLFPKVRSLIWYKPPGSSYAGSSDDNMFYAFENLFLCGEAKKDICTPKDMKVAAILKEGRLAVGISRGAVDMAVRGKKTGLCYRWEEAACLPTSQQVGILKTILRLGDNFDLALADALTAKETTLQKLSERRAMRTDVFVCESNTSGRHPCEKPEKLIDDLILTFTKPNDLILDPFLGTGTTAYSAKKLGRRCIGIEIKKEYSDLAVKRCSQAAMKFEE